MQVELEQLVRSTVDSLGFELWGCEFRTRGGGDSLLCLYIDSPNGITSENCTMIARQVRAVLAVESSLGDKVSLEVSSPGIQRRLYCLDHYQRYVGHRIKLCLMRAKNNQRKFEAEIKQVDIKTETIMLQVADDEPWQLVLRDIEKANLLIEY